ncbi:PorP/SprF family type IX secretion system membrane protein [Bacteroidota bacterium]
MKTFKPIIILVILLLMWFPMKGQDAVYSQWTSNQIYYNPGYVGISQGMRSRFAYRQQWVKLPQDFRNFNFTTDIAARNIPGSGGLGVMFDTDNEGEGYIKRTQIGAVVAVRVPIHSNMITQFGILSSFVQKRIDWNRMVFSDQLDERYGNIYPSNFKHPSDDRVTYPDFGVGGVFRFSQSTWTSKEIVGSIGVAVHHIFEPNETFLQQSSPLPRKYVISGDFIIHDESGGRPSSSFRTQRGGFKYNPGIIYMYQGGMQSYQVGINIHKDPLYIGIWYRNDEFEFLEHDALILMAGINMNFNSESRLKLLYSYDAMLSDVTKATGGTHEFTLIIEFDEIQLFGNKKRGGFGNRGPMHKNTGALECSPF